MSGNIKWQRTFGWKYWKLEMVEIYVGISSFFWGVLRSTCPKPWAQNHESSSFNSKSPDVSNSQFTKHIQT